MDIDYKRIGKNIRQVREDQKITQGKLAEMTDLSVSYISYIETGKKKVSLESLIRIAHVLKVSVDQILNGSQPNNLMEYEPELYELMADCNYRERCLIYELVITVTKKLREYRLSYM